MSTPSAFTTLAAQLDAAFTAAFAAAFLPPAALEEGARVDLEHAAKPVDRVQRDLLGVAVLHAADRRDGQSGLRRDVRLGEAGGFAELADAERDGGHSLQAIRLVQQPPRRRLFAAGVWR